MREQVKSILFSIIIPFIYPLYADVVIGNGNIERLNSGVIKDINCQDYTILSDGLLSTANGGVLREVKKLEINGTWDFGSGQIIELGTWINNGTVALKPTQTAPIPNLTFTALCGPISVRGTSDTDGDGISDADEGDNAVALGYGITLDQDNDGTYNFLDDDSDGDGLTDAVEGGNTIDTDGDGIPDYLDADDSRPNSADDNSLSGNDIGDTIGIDILANDTLNDGSIAVADDVNITLIAPTGGVVNEDGSVTVAGEGTWRYDPSTGILTFTPIEGFTGNPKPISYILTELATGLQSSPATVTVKYDAVEPVILSAADDGTIVITHYGPTPLNVLDNDTYSGTVHIEIVHSPKNGTVEIAKGSDGIDMILYAPEPNINKVKDSFIYAIIDAQGERSEAIVKLDIQCASTQTSDGGVQSGVTLFVMMLLSMFTGLYIVRREENKKA